MVAVLSACSAVSLCRCMAVCKQMRDTIHEHGDLLWRALLTRSYPLLDAATVGSTPPRHVFQLTRLQDPSMRFEVQILNGPGLTRGQFGSATWTRVWYESSHWLRAETTDVVARVPPARARRP